MVVTALVLGILSVVVALFCVVLTALMLPTRQVGSGDGRVQ